jgi:hypothetical protein
MKPFEEKRDRCKSHICSGISYLQKLNDEFNYFCLRKQNFNTKYKQMEFQKTGNGIISFSQIMVVLLAVFIALGGSSCKSKKKLAEEKAAIELANKIAEAKSILKDLLCDDNPKTWQEKKDELDAIKAMQLRDPEVEELIDQVEYKLQQEKMEILKRQEAEAKRKAAEDARMRAQAQYENINAHFSAVSSAPSVEVANERIERALSLYASKDVPVLIIISTYGDNQKDYDKPTTIDNYLNYLKDIKKYNKQIESVKYDESGKIIEIELIEK